MRGGAQRVLVLGATGMLGHVAMAVLAEDFDVHGSVRDLERARRLRVRGDLHELEATRTQDIEPLIDAVAPAAVVNCIGLVKQLDEANRPLPAIALNALFPHAVAEACAEHDARLIQISTDCVFSGELEPPAAYSEDDVPDARDLYGLTKLLGEVTEGDALTLRTSMIGWELERTSGLLQWFVSDAGREVGGFSGAIFSGVTTVVLARTIARILSDHPGLAGIYNVAADPISKFDLLVRLRDALDLDREIEPREEPRINRALEPARLRAETGFEAPPWDEMIAELVAVRPEATHA